MEECSCLSLFTKLFHSRRIHISFLRELYLGILESGLIPFLFRSYSVPTGIGFGNIGVGSDSILVPFLFRSYRNWIWEYWSRVLFHSCSVLIPFLRELDLGILESGLIPFLFCSYSVPTGIGFGNIGVGSYSILVLFLFRSYGNWIWEY
jgi:hypothetical protein